MARLRLSEILSERMPDRLASTEDWGRRIATLVAAVLVGVAALLFARLGDMAQQGFVALRQQADWLPLVLTPVTFLVVAALTRRFASEARGSGIPQVMAASRAPHSRYARALLSLRAAVAKIVPTVVALLGGASVGRAGVPGWLSYLSRAR